MNPYSWLVSRDRGIPELERFTIYADGILLVWLYNICYRRRIQRFAFDYSSIAGLVFDDAARRGRKVYLIGGKQGVAHDASKVILARHTGLAICGMRSGYFDDSVAYQAALDDAMKADVVIVGMGAPAQEAFIAALWQRGWRGAGYTCGGFMDQIIGTDGTYFPAWSNRLRLRWLYRLCKEPRRLWKRYFIDYPIFVIVFVADRFRSTTRPA
jgi:exopolysaccharide biosynthesis WecB/TagA/CpsF family protein